MAFIGTGKIDERGRLFVIYPIKKILNVDSGNTVIFFEEPDSSIRICRAPDNPIRGDPLEETVKVVRP